MRIGRFLTVNDVYNYIDTFLGGAPILCLGSGYTERPTIPNDQYTSITWDWEYTDNWDLWSPSYPQEINIPEAWQGVYEASIFVCWGDSTEGYREVYFLSLDRCDSPSVGCPSVATHLSGLVNGPAWQWEVTVYQNSGAPLEITASIYLRWVQPLPTVEMPP